MARSLKVEERMERLDSVVLSPRTGKIVQGKSERLEEFSHA